MQFAFDQAACQNIRKALRKEWLVSNRVGDYSSSTIVGCNTRKYHGLLVADLLDPPGRHVLLSTLEESVEGDGREFFFSTRKHPGVYYPTGHEHLTGVLVDGNPVFRYRIGPALITREIALADDRPLLLVRYTVNFPAGHEGMPPLTLRVKPLLAFRHMHALTRENMDLQVTAFPVGGAAPGFSVRPYNALPPLYMQVEGAPSRFYPGPDWCREVEYMVEAERGFPNHEDLFMPGIFSVKLEPGAVILLSAGLEEVTGSLAALWDKARRGNEESTAQGHLRREGGRFLVRNPTWNSGSAMANPSGASLSGASPAPAKKPLATGPTGVVAGYHWFGQWGRDTLIALPGLTFAAGRAAEGEAVLAAVSKSMKDGLVPNLFTHGADAAAYNSVDASLWYVWAAQQMLIWAPDREPFFRAVCWPAIKAIIDAYRRAAVGGPAPGGLPMSACDEGLLAVGNAETQLTWMDAVAGGKPVTPRHGCPVEINALWHNALAFADSLAARYGDPSYRSPDLWRMRAVFRHRFWTARDGGHLGDVWRDGELDASIRPNQIFAVSLPYPVLDPDDRPFVVESVRNNLLTPYGLRTLSPRSPDYKGRYEGGPAERDGAYHQGTVWPWLLGAYGEALLKTAWDVDGAVSGLLRTLTPLFSNHLAEAGLGSLSEIFSGDPPHEPDGCIAQAWSVAECHRLLRLLERTAPKTYAAWEEKLAENRTAGR